MNVLTQNMIRGGEQLIGKLDEMGWPVFAAFWFYISEGSQWKLVLASPKVVSDGPKKAYETIQSVLTSIPSSADSLSLSDIAVTDPNDQLIILLRSVVPTGPTISGIRFRYNVINGHVIEDAYIYRLSDRAPQPPTAPTTN